MSPVLIGIAVPVALIVVAAICGALIGRWLFPMPERKESAVCVCNGKHVPTWGSATSRQRQPLGGGCISTDVWNYGQTHTFQYGVPVEDGKYLRVSVDWPASTPMKERFRRARNLRTWARERAADHLAGIPVKESMERLTATYGPVDEFLGVASPHPALP